MSDSDDIPDLDDMSDMVRSIQLNNQSKHASLVTYPVSPISTVKSSVADDKEIGNVGKKQGVNVKESKGQFAGMKKGFLFGAPKNQSKPKPCSPPAKSVTKDSKDIITPKLSNPSGKNPLVFDEVQETMRNDPSSDKSWLTDDLLKQIDSNQKLSKQLMDPHISNAVSWMQRDPKSAMEYYKNDEEIQSFFKEFYGILGNHFTNLGGKQNQDSNNEQDKLDPNDEKAMQKILSNEKIKDILSKPGIQRLLHQLRTDPDEAQKILNSCDKTFRDDVNQLVSAGVLAFQPH